MEIIYLFIVIVLVILALSDLVVGVSNDAVNFVNSAIGSNAASFRVVMIVAALGVLVGALFSSGMMEIARKGIFNPEYFTFHEVMIIFLAVMITDVILLDTFNSAGLPTSTTVSLVFELLGASFAVATMKIIQFEQSLQHYAQYMNTGKVLEIISGILLSIAIAFTVGAVIQYLARLLFSFNYEKYLNYFGGLWSGIATTTIIFFLFVKGAKGTSFMTPETVAWFGENTLLILIVSFAVSAVVFQLLYWIFRTNILKIVVLLGTFSLAMAFAGNDLVNFIGVPLAGLDSFLHYQSHGAGDSDAFTMEMLRDPAQVPTLFLSIAGVVMILTLFLSRKAKTVTKTTVDLGRQEEGDEAFQSSALARGIVYISLQINNAFKVIIPGFVQRRIDERFKSPTKSKSKSRKAPAFDLVRASVILVVSSATIALGTSLKLPLSTTYVTFMVAMGASLADRAWGRESAVYRISGVVTVIGGWFFTALSAFTLSLILAVAIYYGGVIAIVLLIFAGFFFIYKSHLYHKKKTTQPDAVIKLESDEKGLSKSELYAQSVQTLSTYFDNTGLFLEEFVIGLIEHKKRRLEKRGKECRDFTKEIKTIRKSFHKAVRKLDDSNVESGYYFIQILNQISEAQKALNQIHSLVTGYIINFHAYFTPDEKESLTELVSSLKKFFKGCREIIQTNNFTEHKSLLDQKNRTMDFIERMRRQQVRMLKNNETTMKKSMLMLDLLNESRILLEQGADMLRMQGDFSGQQKK